MKKNYFLIISITLLFFINGCTGYKPIFGSTNLPFKILEHSVKGDKSIGNKIYSKLHNLNKSNSDDQNIKGLNILIESSKNKEATAKDSSGKILEYRLTITAQINVSDYVTDEKILNQTFNSSITYKVQDQYSETIKLENRSIENLISKIYEELLVRLSENISS
tara:strand:+ start:29 stop:520 length:492 start_codon:yes stop_codon:yes gene_type:complete